MWAEFGVVVVAKIDIKRTRRDISHSAAYKVLPIGSENNNGEHRHMKGQIHQTQGSVAQFSVGGNGLGR